MEKKNEVRQWLPLLCLHFENYCNQAQEIPAKAHFYSQRLWLKCTISAYCVLCRTNILRVSPVSSVVVRSGVAPSSRQYVRIVQRRRSPPSPRLQERPVPGRRLRWPENPAESQRCRPWFHRTPTGPPPARDIFAVLSALFHKRRIRHGAHPYFQFLTVGPFFSARGLKWDRPIPVQFREERSKNATVWSKNSRSNEGGKK